jgi:hypothetical protein
MTMSEDFWKEASPGIWRATYLDWDVMKIQLEGKKYEPVKYQYLGYFKQLKGTRLTATTWDKLKDQINQLTVNTLY